jgi:ethanolamine ammonia-lyase large subunit
MNERFVFRDLRDLLAKANEEKSGDQLAGLAARSERERVAAKRRLADLSLSDIARQPVIDPSEDEVSRLLLETQDRERFRRIESMTVGEFREFLLDDATAEEQLKDLQWAILPEIAAAAAKIMSNKDLVLAAAKIRNVTHCRNTMGERGVLGIRIQPNHPADDIGGILLAAFEGLLYGCGDAVIGVNPATDSVETVEAILRALARLIDAYRAPTQACCLAHITTQLAAMRRGAPVDLLFQSIAGTEAANRSFGVTLSMLGEGRDQALEQHAQRNVPWKGSNVMYFETGQGSALSAEAHHGVDQLTLEARAYGVARAFHPFLVNSVVGFIGPEYLYDERQIIRAGLEDHFMGKLLGLPMGCDVCYTNHAAADQNSADNLLLLLAAAGCNYFMGVPCSDDVMLNYQSTSYHDALAARRLFHLRPAPEFLAWLQSIRIFHGTEPALLEASARRDLLQGLESSLGEIA